MNRYALFFVCIFFNISTSCHGGIRSFTTVITRASVITV
ncbi:Uncharacterised protein [Salmonella enterica subsp. enterica]|uniref:Uncharacterized protein n=1 Tax=Salmonella enterica I TaxID=59201 RepID=A0A379UYA4_SALET|nr:Uncharacterised protein [Salmonella enterica subsp. enterica]